MFFVRIKWYDDDDVDVVRTMSYSCGGSAQRCGQSSMLRSEVPIVRSRRSTTSLLQVVRSRRSRGSSSDIVRHSRVSWARSRLCAVPARRPRRSVLKASTRRHLAVIFCMSSTNVNIENERSCVYFHLRWRLRFTLLVTSTKLLYAGPVSTTMGERNYIQQINRRLYRYVGQLSLAILRGWVPANGGWCSAAAE